MREPSSPPLHQPRAPRNETLPLRVGRRTCRRRRVDARSSRRQRRRTRRDDESRALRAAGFHDYDRSLQRLLREQRALARRSARRRDRSDRRARAQEQQALRIPRESAARERALGREAIDAGDDGHRPQSRPQRRDASRADRAHERRALRLGRVSALHPDVRPDRARRSGRALRRGARGREAARRCTP